MLGTKSAEVCTDTSGNEPPTLQNPGSQANQVGVALTLQLVGADPESSPVTYSATGLPTGLTINTNTGFLSGTPTTVGTFSVQATISDGKLSTTQAFTWTIGAALPGVATLLRPTGTAASNTPTFEWESVATATSYRLWVDDASATDPKIQIDYTPAQAGCATAGAVCQVKPGIALAAGRASWSIRVSNASGAGPWSGAMDFTVPDTKVPVVAIADADRQHHLLDDERHNRAGRHGERRPGGHAGDVDEQPRRQRHGDRHDQLGGRCDSAPRRHQHPDDHRARRGGQRCHGRADRHPNRFWLRPR